MIQEIQEIQRNCNIFRRSTCCGCEYHSRTALEQVFFDYYCIFWLLLYYYCVFVLSVFILFLVVYVMHLLIANDLLVNLNLNELRSF